MEPGTGAASSLRRTVVVTALPLECEAVLGHLDASRTETHPQGNRYPVGEFQAGDQRWDVLVVEAGQGNPAAAAATERALQFFDPEVTLFVGVGGGIKDVALGDLVVATKVYDTDSGKEAEEFLPRPKALQPSYRLSEVARDVRRSSRWVDRLAPDDRTPDPAVYLGPIASGQQVVSSAESHKAELIARYFSDALAVDMESAGFMEAIHARNDAPALIVRGISDTREGKDPASDLEWQPKAVARAAAFALEVLAKYRGPLVTGAGQQVSNLPVPVAVFEGREVELAGLSETLSDRSGRSRPSMAILHGLGGIGKTRLVLEYAYRHLEDYDVVWLVRGEDALTAHGDLADLAGALQLPEIDQADQEVAVDAVQRWLRDNSRWLLILDDVPSPDVLAHVLPPGCGHVLVTSRHEGGWREFGSPVQVPPFARTDSIALLERRTGTRGTPGNEELSEELGDLPLALVQAAAYIDATEIDADSYLDRFRAARAEMLATPVPADYPATVATTWSLAFSELEDDDQALAILFCSAYIAPQPIPRVVYWADVPDAPFAGGDGILRFDEGLRSLLRFSLVSADVSTLEIHRLVQEVVRQGLGDDEPNWVRGVQMLLEHTFPTDIDTPIHWDLANALVPHAIAAAGHARRLGADDDVTAALLVRVGRYLRARYELDTAEELISQAVDLKLGAEGESIDVAVGLIELAAIMKTRGELPRGATALDRARAIIEAQEPVDLDLLASVLTNLGSMRRQLGNPIGAVESLTRALEIAETVHKSDAPELIAPLVNRANALDDMGRVHDAMADLERAVSLAESGLEESQPDLALVLSIFGSRLVDLGDPGRGRSTQLRALEIYEGIYGEDYAGSAPILVNLGSVELQLGNPAEAKRRFERALELERQALGEDHPDLTGTFLNIAQADVALGASEDAISATQRALDVAEAYGDRAPGKYIAALVRVADFLRRETDQLDRAEELTRLAVERAEQTYGPDHIETAYALRTLGAVLRLQAIARQSMANAEESLNVQNEALTILEHEFGHESGPVADTLSNLGNLLGDIHQLEGAIDLHQEAVRIAAIVYGDDTPAFARNLANLAIAYDESGDEERFHELGRRAFEIAPWLFTEEDDSAE